MNNLELLQERNDQVKWFCYSSLFWFVLFGALQDKFQHPALVRRNSVDINNRIISILHGQIVLWGSMWFLINEQPTYVEKNSHSMHFIIIGSGGYFAYDTLVCIYYNLYDFWLVMHHLTTLIAYAASVHTQFSGKFVIVGLVYAEVSNLPMHLRLILKDCGLKHTKLYETLELLYFFLFIVFRGALCPITLINLWKDINSPLLIKIVGILLILQAAYYIYEMKLILKQKIRQYDERKKKGIPYNWFHINPQIEYLTYTKYEKRYTIL